MAGDAKLWGILSSIITILLLFTGDRGWIVAGLTISLISWICYFILIGKKTADLPEKIKRAIFSKYFLIFTILLFIGLFIFISERNKYIEKKSLAIAERYILTKYFTDSDIKSKICLSSHFYPGCLVRGTVFIRYKDDSAVSKDFWVSIDPNTWKPLEEVHFDHIEVYPSYKELFPNEQ